MRHLIIAFCLLQNSIEAFRFVKTQSMLVQNHFNNIIIKHRVIFNKQPNLLMCDSTNTITIPSSRCDKYAKKLLNSKPGRFQLILRYLANVVVGSLFFIILRVLNSFKIIRHQVLLKNVLSRERGRSLLTVCNHQSLMDDPGLWSAVLPLWCMNPDKVRWSVCTEEVFFFNSILSKLYALGNVIPLDRSGSLDQPLFQRFFEKLDAGNWCHVFPEGRVFQNWRFEDKEPRLGPFKIGVGKLVAQCKRSPLIIPLYHKGMDSVIPEKVPTTGKKPKRAVPPKSIFPKFGNKIEFYVGTPFDLSHRVDEFNSIYPGMLQSGQSTPEVLGLYTQITNDIREEMLKLEKEANGRE